MMLAMHTMVVLAGSMMFWWGWAQLVLGMEVDDEVDAAEMVEIQTR